MKFLLGRPMFRSYLSFTECIYIYITPVTNDRQIIVLLDPNCQVFHCHKCCLRNVYISKIYRLFPTLRHNKSLPPPCQNTTLLHTLGNKTAPKVLHVGLRNVHKFGITPRKEEISTCIQDAFGWRFVNPPPSIEHASGPCQASKILRFSKSWSSKSLATRERSKNLVLSPFFRQKNQKKRKLWDAEQKHLQYSYDLRALMHEMFQQGAAKSTTDIFYKKNASLTWYPSNSETN